MRKPNIKHILANGKRVKSIEGHVVPPDSPVYKILLQTQGEQEVCKKLIV